VTAPLLELRGIRVRAGGRILLAVDGLALEPSSTTAVLGPNGAGKSTLLRVAGALQRPDTGAVLLDGRIAGRADLRAATAAVLQRPLLRRASVRDNVETGLRFRRVRRPDARRRAQGWLERLGVDGLADRPAHTLSGGEAQRVSLARALAVSPRLLLLDEPFAGLDAPTRGELLADLRETLADTATAALLVTHDRHEAAALADRVALLHAGELRQEGRASEVLDHPADADCARVLGFDTVVPGRVVQRHEALVALRAGDCVAAEAGDGLLARLRRVVPLGPETRVIAEVGGHELCATAPAPAPAWLDALRPGEELVVRIDPRAVRPLRPRNDAGRRRRGPAGRGATEQRAAA
jgi:ABC-type sulfate/molybdate transport systems ATPase subunit